MCMDEQVESINTLCSQLAAQAVHVHACSCIQSCALLHGSLFVGQRANDGAENHGRAKARDEEPANVLDVEAIIRIQGVYIGPLQPITGCIGQAQRGCVQALQCCARRGVPPAWSRAAQIATTLTRNAPIISEYTSK